MDHVAGEDHVFGVLRMNRQRLASGRVPRGRRKRDASVAEQLNDTCDKLQPSRVFDKRPGEVDEISPPAEIDAECQQGRIINPRRRGSGRVDGRDAGLQSDGNR